MDQENEIPMQFLNVGFFCLLEILNVFLGKFKKVFVLTKESERKNI